jgi:hypothetical protein
MKEETIRQAKERSLHPSRSARPGPSGETRFCWHCDREVSPVRAVPGWRLGIPALVIAVFASVTVAVLAGPFMLIALVPLLLFVAALGPYVARMRAADSCPRCGREVPYVTRDQAYEGHGGPPRGRRDSHRTTTASRA